MSGKLKIAYEDTTGQARTISYNNVAENLGTSTVKTICNSFVGHARIFTYRPSKVTGATLVLTSENPYDLEDE